MIEEMLRRYEELLEKFSYADSACWTVVQPVTRPLTAGAERLGGRAEDMEDEPRYDIDERDYALVCRIDQRGSSSVIVEEYGGHQGTRREVLRRLSDSSPSVTGSSRC